MTTSRLHGGAGWWKSPCPDLERARGGQLPRATRQRGFWSDNGIKAYSLPSSDRYPWVDAEGLGYFRSRTTMAPRDAAFGLAFVVDHATTLAAQQRCVAAITRKCEILWGLLDAVEAAHRHPRLAPQAMLRDDQERPGHLLAVLPERGVRVSESGREILELCDGTRSSDAVATALRERHPQVEHITSDVHEFLDQMEQLGVILRDT